MTLAMGFRYTLAPVRTRNYLLKRDAKFGPLGVVTALFDDARLMAAQTPLGQAIYRHLDLDPVQFETNILLEEGRAWFKSVGTIRMFVHLGFPWSLLGMLRFVPERVLDRLYDVVARNRLRWFGSNSICLLADAAYKDRFLG